MTAPRPRPPWWRLLVLAAVIALGWALLRRLDLARLLEVLRHASIPLLALAALLNLTLNTAARVARWAPLVGALPHGGRGAGFAELAKLFVASQAASNLLPANAGDALRVVQLHRRHGYPVSGLVTARLVEAVVQALTLALLALLIVPSPETPASLSAALLTFAALGLGGGLSIFWLARRAPAPPRTGERAASKGRSLRFIARAREAILGLVEAARHFQSPRVWLESLFWSLVSDLIDVLMIGLVLKAVGISLSPVAWLVTFVALNLVLILPSTPAQVGVLEVGAVAALRALGVDEHPALAFALLYHAAHVLPPTLVGGPLLARVELAERRGEHA